MKNAISIAITMITITFFSIILTNVMMFNYQVAKLNDYHYGVVSEIENSDFSPMVIQNMTKGKEYKVKITNKTIKEDLGVYQVTTSKTLHIPLFGFSKEYVKESIAR